MKKLIPAVALLLVTSIAIGAAADNSRRELSRNLNIFNSLVKELNTFYVDTLDAKKAIGTAIDAMLSELDPYTEYIPEEEQEDFRSMTTGEYGGIGSVIMQMNGNVYISEPTEGAPAALAGLRPGDMIISVDGDTVLGKTTADVSTRLKGQAGTNVKVTVRRPHVQDSILTFDLTRSKIQMPSVPYYGVYNGNIGYIALTSFTEKSPAEVKEALLALKANPEVKSIVLDLRGNGGGLLESAVSIINFFVPKGTQVLSRKGRDVMSEKIYKTTSRPIDTDIPLVVMIDGGTASAAEIVSGALQDLDRGVIVGTRSFGKGLVQTTRPLPFNGMLKVTTSKYYIPSGRLIQAIDYSNRNADGSVSRIPDSLTTVFHTAAGREVRDGGGITPDVTVSYPDYTRLTYNIVRDNWDFNFATKYVAEHPDKPSPADFRITDTIYSEFKAFIDPERFNYDKVCETTLEQFREIAKNEGYLNDSVAAQFKVLEGMLRHDLGRDLDFNRKDIEPFIAGEIMNRYHYKKGETENRLHYDNMMDTVVDILGNESRYSSILAAPDKKK